ncbi:MAG TPA: hypothetical protein VFJ43_15005 [Bacteroidia bacterium]|nr:hypothetical protein [Bacteroidia bacterium]
MNSRIFCFLALFVLIVAADSKNALDEKNGFKKYKLGTLVSSYPGFKYADAKHQSQRTDSCAVVYEKEAEMSDNIGETKVSKIYLTASNDTIVKIEVPLAEAGIPKIVESFSKEFGKYTKTDNGGNTTYEWEGTNVKMSLVDNSHRRGDKDYAKSSPDVITVTSKEMEAVKKRCTQSASH